MYNASIESSLWILFFEFFYYCNFILQSAEKKFPIFDQSFIGDFYLEMESSDIVKPHTRCYKYLSHTIFGMINIQGLNYGGFAQLIRNNYDQEGNMLEIEMKKHLIKG